MKRIYIALVASLTLLTLACNEDELVGEVAGNDRVPIRLSANYQTVQRVTDAGFADGDRMGVFIVDYNDGTPEEMQPTGNRANNVLFTYNETENRWIGATTIYWKDDRTPVDVVGYYPFTNDLSSVTAYAFSVQSNQNSAATDAAKAGYEASDFLWAKCSNVAPTTDKINLLYQHRMAGVTVRLVEGSGFADGEWMEATKQVWVDNTTLDACINLQDGSVTPVAGSVGKIVPLEANGEYRAVVVPQVVAAKQALIGINIDNVSYLHSLDAAMTYYSGKMHTFTIEVDKRIETGDYEFKVIDESITPWVDDLEFHDGLINDYVVVHVDAMGTLAQRMREEKLNYRTITRLKVVGHCNLSDCEFMRDSMPILTHLNMYDVRMENDEIGGFSDKATLRRVVLPKVLKVLGGFGGTGLTGTIDIPEGVTTIGFGAFAGCPLNAAMKFPSTLKRIEGAAFRYGGLSGEIQLPEGLEYIGLEAFQGPKLEGPLVLPSTLKYIGEAAFNSASFSGTLVIPQGCELGIGCFDNCQFSHIEIPEGIKVIDERTFKYVPIQGELLLPSSLSELKSYCFTKAKISSVVLPENLKLLESGTFADCSRLEGIIEIPKSIQVIDNNVFDNCHMLDGIKLHKDVVFIASGSFKNCYNMSSIVCDAEVPPVIEPGAFDGVPKDNFTVEVPAKSVAAYKMAEGWKEFKRIAPYSNFVCRPAKICAVNNRHDEQIILNADGAWRVTYKPDWCELSQTSGTGKTSLRLTVKELAHGSADRNDSIVFELNGGQFSTYCAVRQCDYEHEEDELVTLQTHTKGKGIDIVFLGDGYDADALSEGKFMNLARRQMEYFFGLPPYDHLRDYFNVYAAVSLSQEQGVNTVNTYRNTRFGTIYGGGGCGTVPNLIPDDEVIFPYVKELMGKNDWDMARTLVILVPNTTEYNSITYLYDDGRSIAICPESTNAYPDDTRGVVQREAGGFAFAKLANEKATKYAFPKQTLKDQVKEQQDWHGWYKNISITGKLADVPWAHYIFDPRYSDYVDVFEGAYGYFRGFFRSESQSCVSTGIPYYNVISRELITRRVMDYAGEPFDMQDFYAKDTNKWGASSMNTRGTSYPSELRSNIQAPIVVKGKYITNKPRLKK